jgi:hypothetical protein
MMPNLMRPLSLAIFLFLVFGEMSAQITDDLVRKAFKSESKRIHNFPNAPVRLEATKDYNYFRLVNLAAKTIVKFDFACIEVNAGRPSKVVREFEPGASYLVPIRILRDDSLIFGGTGSGISECATSKERLTVSKLTYSDETIWSFSEHCEDKPK